MNYAELLPHCKTDRQTEIVQACVDHGSQPKAARSLGIHLRTVERRIAAVRLNASNRTTTFDNGAIRTLREGFSADRLTEQYGEGGELQRIWVKSKADKNEKIDLIAQAAQTIADDIKPAKKIKAPKSTHAELINVYPMGDPHVGLYCWQAETGNDFDCDIAENLMVSAIDYLVENSPDASECLIINLGDFYHADTAEGVTLRSGHKLDVDTRWPRVLEIGIRAFRRSIDRALLKHDNVTVISAIGNHDDHSSVFLNIVLREYYRDNPRVTIADNKTVFQYHQFGKNLFGVTHGHTIKPLDLEGIMTRDCNDVWSDTLHRKWFVGHFHSQRKHDMRNCEVEYYRTLAPGDAWSIASGYRSFRDMRRETYHKEYGRMGSDRFDPIMLS